LPSIQRQYSERRKEMNSRQITILFTVVLIIILFSDLRCVATPPLPPPTSYVVSVLDSTTGEFVGSPTIILRTYEYNNYSGTFKDIVLKSPDEIPIFVIPNTTIHLVARKEGYKDSEPYIYNVSENPPKYGIVFVHTFYLDPLPTTKVNIYTKEKGGNRLSIENATIKAKAINSNENFTGKTDENGLFTFETRMINYEITVTKEGYYDHYQTFEVDHNVSEMNLTITLEETPPVYHRGVYLTIKNSEGKPISNATVNIRSVYSDEVNLTNTTDENGIVMFVLTSDDYYIYVYTDTYGSEKFVRWISNKGSAYEDDLQMGVGEGTPIEQPEHKVEYKAFNVPPTLIIFIVIILFVILLLVFKVVKKPKEVENKYSL